LVSGRQKDINERKGIMDIIKYDIVMHNNDKTPFDLVCYVLEEIFDMTSEEANKKALEIHNNQKSIVGTYIYEIAVDKQYQATAIFNANGYFVNIDLQINK
jgi:ATP-dependent Clp protease adapter protein ClpS